MNGNDMIEWIEGNIEDLTDKFIEENDEGFNVFLNKEYIDYCSGEGDYLETIYSDR